MEKAYLFLLLILLVGIVLRLLLLIVAPQNILFEPDNFYYFAVMKETLANNGLIPNLLPFSGFPVHNSYQEFPGLIYITLIPYWLTGGLLPLIGVMYAMPVIFGMLGIIITYLLAKRFFKKVSVALVAAAFYSLLPAAVYRTSAMQYRGESFVPVLLALFVLWRTSDNINYRKASWALIPITLVFWKASVYIIPIIAIAFILMSIEKKQVKTQTFALACIFLVILITAYFALVTFEWSPNIEEGITEALAPSPGYLFLMFNWVLILAPMAWVCLFLDKKQKKNVLWPWLTAILLVTVPLALLQERWVFLLAIPVAVFAAKGVEITYSKLNKTRVPPMLLITIVLSMGFLISVAFLFEQGNFVNLVPELQATAWINNNTAQNSTFLADWSDGSIIEGWGNRISYTDSVNTNGTKIEDYAEFLLAENGNYSYIKEVKPDYLFISSRTSPTVFEQEENLITNGINLSDTNLNHLINGTANLPIAYDQNGVVIYNVTSLWKT